MHFTYDEFTLLYSIIIFSWAQSLWSIYLSWRQYKLLKATKEAPEIVTKLLEVKDFERTRLYAMEKLKFLICKELYSVVIATWVLYFGMLYKFWWFIDKINYYKGEIMHSCIWMVLFLTFQAIVDLPFILYHMFVLEEKFGHNDQQLRPYLGDHLKSFVLQAVVMIPVVSRVVMAVKDYGNYVFIILWIGQSVVGFIMYIIYPSVIAPLFDKYTVLPDCEIRTKILKLCHDVNFPIAEIYVVEGTQRLSHSKSFIYGLSRKKNIVLYDTLLDGSVLDNDAILALLSHKIGHWLYNHIIKNVISMQIHFFIAFIMAIAAFQSPLIYKMVGFKDEQPILIGLLVVINYTNMPYDAVHSYLVTFQSRIFEFHADAFVVGLGKGKELKSAILKLQKGSYEFPIYDYLYAAWHNMRPETLERIAALDLLLNKM